MYDISRRQISDTIITSNSTIDMIENSEDVTRIRDLLSKNSRGLSITEISRELSLHRTTVSKYLDTLRMKGEVDLRIVSTAKVFYLSRRIPGASIPVITRDPYLFLSNKLHITGSGNAFAELMGVTETELKGRIISDPLFSFLHTSGLQGRFSDAIKGTPSISEEELIISGKEGWFETSILPVVFDDGRNGCTLLLRDITNWHYAVESSKISGEEIRAFMGDMNDFIFRIRRDGILTYANEVFCRRMEKKEDELIGFPFEPLISAEETSRLQKLKSEIVTGDPLKIIELQTILPDGMVCREEWKIRGIFSISGRLIEYQVIGRDISHVKNLEEQLAAYHTHTEERISQRTREMQIANKNLIAEISRREVIERELLIIQFVFDQASDSIILFTRTGEVYRANETGCILLGYTKDEIMRKTVFEISPEITPAIWEKMWSDSNTITDSIRALSIHRRKDGSIIPVELSRKFIRLPTISLFCSIARKRETFPDSSADSMGIRPEQFP